MKHSVFVYGSLMSPKVVELLLGRIPKMESACRLAGYSRHPVKNHVFPAMVPSTPTSQVDGMVWLELTDTELKAFDWFEDVEYKRIPVTVQPQNTNKPGRNIDAEAYLWANPHSQLELDREWSFDNFCTQNLDWYLTNTVGPSREEWDRVKDEL